MQAGGDYVSRSSEPASLLGPLSAVGQSLFLALSHQGPLSPLQVDKLLEQRRRLVAESLGNLAEFDHV